MKRKVLLPKDQALDIVKRGSRSLDDFDFAFRPMSYIGDKSKLNIYEVCNLWSGLDKCLDKSDRYSLQISFVCYPEKYIDWSWPSGTWMSAHEVFVLARLVRLARRTYLGSDNLEHFIGLCVDMIKKNFPDSVKFDLF